MTVWLQHIETMVPEMRYPQDYASRRMQELVDDERKKRLIRIIYRNSGIDNRHSVIPTFVEDVVDDFILVSENGDIMEPGTAARNEIFARESRSLSVKLARKVIADCPGINAESITHLVTVSCTGFYNPGPDYFILYDLDMPYSTQRYHLGFMGCYAAFPALRMAKQFCLADPEAVVLVMCLELCSLHLQIKAEEDNLLANALFADGAGAAIVSSRPPEVHQNAYRMEEFNSSLLPDGLADMTWSIGDLGFDIALSRYIPKLVGANIRNFVEPSLTDFNVGLDDVHTWAVHPGGKGVLDKVQSSLGLSQGQVQASRDVLRNYGNMSSATILFILQDILRNPSSIDNEKVCALAFGPGLSLELGLFEAQRGNRDREQKVKDADMAEIKT